MYDVIIVLAGGLDKDGNIYEWVKRRLDLAIEYYNKNKVPIIVCGGGTYHKPPILNDKGFVMHESSACVNYLREYGKIDTNFIYKEWSSYDTIGNVYFSLVEHIKLMDVNNILVITSDFHMRRAKLIFEWIYNLNKKYNLEFKIASDNGLENIIKERIERENESYKNIEKNLVNKLDTLKKVHDWLYTEHNAYSSREWNLEINCEKIKKTY